LTGDKGFLKPLIASFIEGALPAASTAVRIGEGRKITIPKHHPFNIAAKTYQDPILPPHIATIQNTRATIQNILGFFLPA
jgi:hypothetical protein